MKFVEMKEELSEFEKEKREIGNKYNQEINRPENRVACIMTAILYEYKRIEAIPRLRQFRDENHEKASTPEGRVQMLLEYIQKKFDRNEMQIILETLKLGQRYGKILDTQTTLEAIPKVEELAKPILEKVEEYKKELISKFLGHNIPFMHISPADITDGKINSSHDLENQPRNNIVTGVFATSSYIGMNTYIGRAISGGMIVDGRSVSYNEKNPFAPLEEQKNPSRVKLAKSVYAYSLLPEGFEPQVHFERRGPNFSIEFGNEWVCHTKDGLSFFEKEEIREISSAIVLGGKVYCKDENGEKIDFSARFAEKHGIDMSEAQERQTEKSRVETQQGDKTKFERRDVAGHKRKKNEEMEM